MKKDRTIESISLLSRNLKIEGDISGNENFRIDGTIKGSVDVTGDVLVEEAGVVEADIQGQNIIVKGSVKGNLTANHRIEIRSTGNVTGDISARSVDIQEGAKFEGRSHMVRTGVDSLTSSANQDTNEKEPHGDIPEKEK